MGDDFGVLRIEIDGMWTASEFAELFSNFEALNEMATYGDASQDEQSAGYLRSWQAGISGRPMRFSPPWTFDYELELRTEDFFREISLQDFMGREISVQPLQVGQIKFASPGLIDLLGAGRIVGHISKFILGVTDRYLAKDDRAIARDIQKQKLLQHKIANADRLLKLGSKVRMDPEAKRQLVRRALELDEYVENKIIDGKITSASLVDLKGNTYDDRPPRKPRGAA